MKKYLKYGIMGILATIISFLFLKSGKTEEKNTIRNYREIVQSGVLRAITEYNSFSFHAQEDTISGFHYELLHAFAQSKNLKVEITPEMSLEKRQEGINNGSYDILANNVLKTDGEEDSILYSHPILLSKQVLVQRNAQEKNDEHYIYSLLDLSQKTVHVVKDSPFINRILNLSNEIGDTIYIKEIDKYGPEQLVAMVANGDIDYAVCDESIVLASIKYFPQIDIETAISFTQFYSWGVNKNNTELLDSLNAWIETFKQTPAFEKLNKKYNNSKL
ncbi:MAG: transporter substrate-binding domain-containing protein [Bacteroidaceae bacterium]|nr:transporter substrate-binding domain-containing protein [Bacteroidaceae bacterium]